MKALKALRFGPIICQWIYTLYNKTKSAVVVNGHTSPWCSIERECRQGDPLSPYLFLLYLKILGIMIGENRLILMTQSIRLRILLMILR